jgi:hypothetical protein
MSRRHATPSLRIVHIFPGDMRERGKRITNSLTTCFVKQIYHLIMALVPLDDAQIAVLIAGGMNPEVAGVHQALSVCGISEAGHIRFVAEGFTSLLSFRNYSARDLGKVAKALQGRPVATRVQIGLIILKNLKALAFWVQDNRCRGLNPDSTGFTTLEMHNVRDRMQVEASKLGDEDHSDTLSKCNPKKFTQQSKLEFVNFLK